MFPTTLNFTCKCALIFSFFAFTNQYKAQTLNVLFIGNSYTHMNNMPKIFEHLAKSKGKKVYADSIAVSGSSLKQHSERPSTYAKMKTRKWDYVVVQGYSREFAQDSSIIATETIPYARQIIDSVLAVSPCASIYFYMTWGYMEGFPEQEPNNNYFKMQERIRNGYFQISNALGYPIVPVGMVWKYLTEQHPEVGLYHTDKEHPSPLGSYVSACSFYTSFFKESPISGTAPRYVDTTYLKTIQKAAELTILPNLSQYKLDQVQNTVSNTTPLINFSLDETWLSVKVRNKSQKVDSFFWEFGDGATSNKNNPTHYYRSSGTYTVTLHVNQDCQKYVLKKLVTVSNKEKHASSRKRSKKS